MFGKIAAAMGLSKSQPEEEVTQVINMYDAMLVHSAWKKRLNEYLEGRSKEDLQPGNIRVDHLCVLGKWIHSDGKARFGHHPEYAKLVEEHAKFHQHAAQVVEAHQVGDTNLAQEILKGIFEEQSRRTVTCLTRLNAIVEEHHQNSASH
ncbi:MAG: CZB domain-containing protein [Gammaproteobacteria bacterium]|nr:CZB domain-containing protein [Gammaproteobacteria bacterium]MBU1482594.1 CZB domain-containing protein [Gammaproteobacteria bacterium]